MSTVDTVRSVISHRGKSCLELHRLLGELTRKVRQLAQRAEQASALEARLDEQAQTINSLRLQLHEAKTIRAEINAKAGRCDEAEKQAMEARRQLADQTRELLALRAFKSNVTAVTPLPRHQAPAAPPADRFETGTPVRLGASPMASANAETQPIPKLVAEPVAP